LRHRTTGRPKTSRPNSPTREPASNLCIRNIRPVNTFIVKAALQSMPIDRGVRRRDGVRRRSDRSIAPESIPTANRLTVKTAATIIDADWQ
jgi:hypothetical protein